jgi:DNA-directed RNA polymerase specialized sigma24 family protein
VNEHDWLAQRFETHRTHLRAVAYRMLGSISEADDAVQEAWLRLSRSDTSAIHNPGGWLTTVVGRVCLDMHGAVGVVVAPRGRLLAVLGFTITRRKIVEIDILANPASLRQLDLALLDD